MKTKLRVINTFFIPVNLILKKFNYLLIYDYMNNIDPKTFETKLQSEYISIIKFAKIPNEKKYCKILKEYKILEFKYL